MIRRARTCTCAIDPHRGTDGQIPPPTLLEWFKSLAIRRSCIAVTYAAWLIPIGWIRWPAVIVAGFFLAAGLFVLGLDDRRPRSASSR